MHPTRMYWLIGSLTLTNLFVLYYYQNSGQQQQNDQNRFNQGDVIASPLIFDSRQQTVSNSQTTQQFKMEARAWELFDASFCVDQTFRVYVHNLSPKLANSSSAHSLHSALEQSPYSTKNLREACLFVYVAHADENLKELPFWNKDGNGLLIIFADGHNVPLLYSNRRAFFVGQNGLNTPYADLQVYTKVTTETKNLPRIFPFQKRQFLLSLMTSKPTKKVANYFSSSMSKAVFVDFGCRSKSGADLGLCEDESYRVEHLRDSVFTLLLPEMEAFSQRFYEALLYGTIPVVVGSPYETILPFAEFIQWRRAALMFPQHHIGKIQEILPEVGVQKILELRRSGRFYLENYLHGSKNLVRSILTAYRNRLGLSAPWEKVFKSNIIYATHPMDSISKPPNKIPSAYFDFEEQIDFSWNQNPVYMDARPLIPIRYIDGPLLADMDSHVEGQQTITRKGTEFKKALTGNYPDEKFTIIIVTYKRDEQAVYTLKMLNNTRFVDRILVVWNDIQRALPTDLIPKISIPIFVVNASKNSLNNRFLPFDLIRTEAVFNMDDDFNTNLETIEFSFKVWRENRLSIVGPNFRLGYMRKDNEGVYVASGECQQNLILTSGAFLHRIYLQAYTNILYPEIRQHVDQKFNCEDIAVNFLVSHLTRRPPIKTTPIENTKGKKYFSGGGGLHERGSSHYSDRSICIDKFVGLFGYNPLVISEYRANSILNGKCYKTT